MATVRKRKGLHGDKYFAEIRRKGFQPARQSFKTSVAANRWVRRVESSMDDGTWIDTSASGSVSIDQLVDEAIANINKFSETSGSVQGPKLSQLHQLKEYFYGVSIHDIDYEDVLTFAAERRATVAASTLQTQMYYLKQVITESRIKTANTSVVDAIKWLTKKKLIGGSVHRVRRLEPGEYEALVAETSGTRLNSRHWIYHVMEIAVESGMRQGEIHALEWADVDFKKRIISSMRKDKDSEGGKKLHRIPMLKGAREALLRAQDELGGDGRVFHVKKASSISDKFARMRKRIGIFDLRFHDLRHEAISRMFERGMRIERVQMVSGHSSLEQLQRYTNLRPEDVSAEY
jgi:integrase